MLLVLDTCNIGLGPEPTGGLTLQLDQIEGLPGLKILVPVAGESAKQLVESATQILGKVKVFDMKDLKSVPRVD